MKFFRRNKSKRTKQNLVLEESHSSVSEQKSISNPKSYYSNPQRAQSPVEEREGPPQPRFLRMTETTGSSQFHHSDARSKMTNPTLAQISTGKRSVPAYLPPPTLEAAFHGPPRFDWIDIVSDHC